MAETWATRQTLNQYAYLSNMSLANIDPTGMACYPGEKDSLSGDCTPGSDSGWLGLNYFSGGLCDPVANSSCVFMPRLPYYTNVNSLSGFAFDLSVGIGNFGGDGESLGLPGGFNFPAPSLLSTLADILGVKPSDACEFGPCSGGDLGIPGLMSWQSGGPDPTTVANSMSQYALAQTSNCYNGFHKTLPGKAVQIGSVIAMTPVASNYKDNLLETFIGATFKVALFKGLNLARGTEVAVGNVLSLLVGSATAIDTGALVTCGAAGTVVP